MFFGNLLTNVNTMQSSSSHDGREEGAGFLCATLLHDATAYTLKRFTSAKSCCAMDFKPEAL